MNSSDLNTLGQVLETSWGKASTSSLSATTSIKTSLSAQTGKTILTTKYVVIISLGSMQDVEPAKIRNFGEAEKITKEYVKNVKKEFKDLSGKVLTLKDLNCDDSIEIIDTSAFTPRKTAYYRFNAHFDVSAS